MPKQNFAPQRVITRAPQQQIREIQTNDTILENARKLEASKPKEVKKDFKYMHMTGKDMIDISFDTFEGFYKNRVKKTNVESIVNGEIITTKPDNIFVNTTTFEDAKFEDKCSLCNKKLYDYQINAIKMIRELELLESYKVTREIVNELTGETSEITENIVSNGWLLHLPIGSGKSLVFTFLALMYRSIPPKPIVISTSGMHIPECSENQIQLKFYPFYYENVGYIEGKENAIAVLKDYNQRKMTVIITHHHLIDQLKEYLAADFKQSLLSHTKIAVALRPNEIRVDCDILIIAANIENINRLVALSYEHPFMRIIVDDYTNMNGIEEYRQIRATSTLFVSGSGFERDKNKIPPSYYTLRHIDVDKFSLVAPVEETSKGILRSNVATFNLIGSESEFSIYKFINEIDESCLNRYRIAPANLYSPIIKNNGRLLDYLSLNFIIKNYDKLNSSISLIMRDLESKKLQESKVKYFLEWKKCLDTPVKELVYDRKTGKRVESEKENPLKIELFRPINQIPQGINTMLMNRCQICRRKPEEHNGWGFISCCCGSFFCIDCAKSMVTRDIILRECNSDADLMNYHDNNHYYCTVCHKVDPVFVTNSTRHKIINNIQTYHIVDQYMETNELKGCAHIDYYFKMFMTGFKPKFFEGQTIICELDSNYDKSKLGTNEHYSLIQQLFPKDQLAMNCINSINESLKKLEIRPYDMNTVKPCILVYACPDYMQTRLEQYFMTYSRNKDDNLYGLRLLFKNSLNELIGLHQNVLGIIVWNNPSHIDEIQQLIGRIVRLNNWNNPIYFYITCTGINLKGDESDKKTDKEEESDNKTLGTDIMGGDMLKLLRGVKNE